MQVTKSLQRQRNPTTNVTQKVFRDQVTKKPENLNSATPQPNVLMKNATTTSHVMSSMHPILLESSMFAISNNLDVIEEFVRTSDDEEDRVFELDEDGDYSDDSISDTLGFVVDDYETLVKQREQNEKQKNDRMNFLLTRSELKFKLGKLFDSYNDCKEAEEIARELGASDSIQAKCLYFKGRCKFKLGDTKAAHVYLNESLQFQYMAEAEYTLKEVEKMAYFEALIDPSSSNPIHQASMLQQVQYDYEFSSSLKPLNREASSLVPSTLSQGFVLDSTVRSNMPTPKMITQHKFKSGKTTNSWQGAYLLYNKKCLQDIKTM